MSLPIKLISTDFDGTVHTDFERPPVPQEFQALLARLQSLGAIWVINTGRDLTSLTLALEAADLSIRPDYVVTVEREIHCRVNGHFAGLDDWNQRCAAEHERLFLEVSAFLPELVSWVNGNFTATVYEDDFSPFCVIARDNADADVIQEHMEKFCLRIPDLAWVRNDVYARFSHRDFNKGSALAEIGRRIGVGAEHTFAAGDHLNDLPMLSTEYARWLVAPVNAVPAVKEAVRRQNGYVSQQPHGCGVARGLEFFLEASGVFPRNLNPSIRSGNES